jgi:hypothetical protein
MQCRLILYVTRPFLCICLQRGLLLLLILQDRAPAYGHSSPPGSSSPENAGFCFLTQAQLEAANAQVEEAEASDVPLIVALPPQKPATKVSPANYAVFLSPGALLFTFSGPIRLSLPNTDCLDGVAGFVLSLMGVPVLF